MAEPRRWQNCPNCNGSGVVSGREGVTECPVCGGSGRIDPDNWKECPTCNGNGNVWNDEGDFVVCPTCGGYGIVRKAFHEKLSKGDRQVLGGTGGALFGAAIGGPAGAIAGGVIGAILAGESTQEEEAADNPTRRYG